MGMGPAACGSLRGQGTDGDRIEAGPWELDRSSLTSMHGSVRRVSRRVCGQVVDNTDSAGYTARSRYQVRQGEAR